MKKITIIPGDGIGYEIMDSVLAILEKLNLNINFEIVNAGSDVLAQEGELVPQNVYDSLENTRVALKGPITTPIGSGFKSINVSLRKKYDLYQNIRKIKTFENIETRYKNVNLTIFRENTEDLYTGEEYKSQSGDAIAIKRISYNASHRIIKAAFEYAKENNFRKVTIAHKANIQKVTDGLFLQVAREIASEYSDISLEEVIIDNMCMQLVIDPTQFNVIVTTNLYGDIISDLAAGLIGGLGLVPGANIGADFAIFEAAHGSAPDIAGRGIANPTALLLSAIEMLKYIGNDKEAKMLNEALLKVMSNKENLTIDVGGNKSTKEFTELVIMAINEVKE